jgi:hypothetical protein
MGMSLQEWRRFFTGMHGLDALVGRVSTSGRKPVFMVGSGLSLPEKRGDPGVPGAAGMIDLIRARLSGDQAALDELNRRLGQVAEEDASVYGAAFELLNSWRGPDAVNKVVSDAVLGARLPGARQSDDAGVLEEDLGGWALNRGTRALGSLLARHREKYPQAVVLTTNFDPLISIAINRAHGRSDPIFLTGDRPLPPMAELKSDETPVMHLHGYWRGVDTQHTWMELTASRPRLGASLHRLLDNRLVVVVGYEGWDDAFMRAVGSLLSDPDAHPDIVWAVYDDDLGKLFARHAALMDHFEAWRDRPRFRLYRGIDGNEFFQRLLDRADGETADRADGETGPAGTTPGPSPPTLAGRLHESAALFDRFIGECAAGRKVPGDRRMRLLARLADLKEAFRPLRETELKTWPDKEFVGLVRTPRNDAREQMTRLHQALSRNEDPRARLRQLADTLTQIRDLIRERVPAVASSAP